MEKILYANVNKIQIYDLTNFTQNKTHYGSIYKIWDVMKKLALVHILVEVLVLWTSVSPRY